METCDICGARVSDMANHKAILHSTPEFTGKMGDPFGGSSSSPFSGMTNPLAQKEEPPVEDKKEG